MNVKGGFVSKIKIKKETFPIRCEICHKGDCFDSQIQFCSRCSGLTTELTSFSQTLPEKQNAYFATKDGNDFFGKITNACLLVGAVLGALFMLVYCVRLDMQKDFFLAFILMMLLGASIGAMMGFMASTFLTAIVEVISFFVKVFVSTTKK